MALGRVFNTAVFLVALNHGVRLQEQIYHKRFASSIAKKMMRQAGAESLKQMLGPGAGVTMLGPQRVYTLTCLAHAYCMMQDLFRREENSHG